MDRANINTCPASMGNRSMAIAAEDHATGVRLSNEVSEGFEVVVLEVLGGQRGGERGRAERDHAEVRRAHRSMIRPPSAIVVRPVTCALSSDSR